MAIVYLSLTHPLPCTTYTSIPLTVLWSIFTFFALRCPNFLCQSSNECKFASKCAKEFFSAYSLQSYFIGTNWTLLKQQPIVCHYLPSPHIPTSWNAHSNPSKWICLWKTSSHASWAREGHYKFLYFVDKLLHIFPLIYNVYLQYASKKYLCSVMCCVAPNPSSGGAFGYFILDKKKGKIILWCCNVCIDLVIAPTMTSNVPQFTIIVIPQVVGMPFVVVECSRFAQHHGRIIFLRFHYLFFKTPCAWFVWWWNPIWIQWSNGQT